MDFIFLTIYSHPSNMEIVIYVRNLNYMKYSSILTWTIYTTPIGEIYYPLHKREKVFNAYILPAFFNKYFFVIGRKYLI